MPPILASILCYAFVFWVYRWEAKTFPDRSKILWVPTLWFMRCGSRGVDAWVGGFEGGRLDPICVAIMFVIGLVILVKRPVRWGPFIVHNSALFMFHAYMVVSLFWASELESPLIKVFRPLTDLFMALIVVTDQDPKDAIITVFRRTAILLIPASILLIKYYHSLGFMQAKNGGDDTWIGVTTHKNPLGQLALASFLGFLWTVMDNNAREQPPARRWVPWLYLLLCVYIFNGGGDPNSRSTTSLLCLIIAGGLVFAFGRMKHQVRRFTNRLVLATALLAGAFSVMVAFDIDPKSLVAQSQGKSADLAGRDVIWSETIRIAKEEHLLFGSGYGGFWVPSVFDKLDPRIDNHPLQAHNGYIEVFANLGVVGVGLMIAFILQSLKSGIKTVHMDFEYGRLRLVLIVITLFMNYSEATFPVALHIWWFGFLVAAFYAAPWTKWPKAEAEEQPVAVDIEIEGHQTIQHS